MPLRVPVSFRPVTTEEKGKDLRVAFGCEPEGRRLQIINTVLQGIFPHLREQWIASPVLVCGVARDFRRLASRLYVRDFA